MAPSITSLSFGELFAGNARTSVSASGGLSGGRVRAIWRSQPIAKSSNATRETTLISDCLDTAPAEFAFIGSFRRRTCPARSLAAEEVRTACVAGGLTSAKEFLDRRSTAATAGGSNFRPNYSVAMREYPG